MEKDIIKKGRKRRKGSLKRREERKGKIESGEREREKQMLPRVSNLERRSCMYDKLIIFIYYFCRMFT